MKWQLTQVFVRSGLASWDLVCQDSGGGILEARCLDDHLGKRSPIPLSACPLNLPSALIFGIGF
jgi:hypothetical protein